ncbi:MAG: hypothetical protein KDA61_03860 [Planctomycetales bacterium]|nr:hypothetical protein [Planctomycetales bacterium]
MSRSEAELETLMWAACLLLPLSLVCSALWRRQRIDAAAEPRTDGLVPAKTPANSSWRDATAAVAQTFRSRYLAGIALSVILASVCATLIYNLLLGSVQSQIPDPKARAQWFAQLNAYQNLLTFFGQAAVASLAIRWLGVGKTLAIVPSLCAIGFAAYAWRPSLVLIGALDVAQRVLSFVLTAPAREVLFAKVAPDEKYRAKSFIDTVGKRGGDAASAYVYAAVLVDWRQAAASLAMIPVAIALAGVLIWLGRVHDRR